MKFRRKLTIIDATQFVQGDPLPKGVTVTAMDKSNPSMGNHHVVRTVDGETHVQPGDWIITDEQGRISPCHPAVFAFNFERIE